MSRPGNCVVVVGASAAGLSAADGLREGGYDGPVVVIDTEPNPGYDRTMLSKGLMATKEGAEPLALRSSEQLAAKGIELLDGHAAMGIDIDRRRVVTNWGEAIPFQEVVIATGVSARPLATTSGRALPTLRTRADLVTARDVTAGHGRVTLVGAGFIGLEVAASLRSRERDVTVVSDLDLPLAQLVGEQVARWVAGLHRDRGVAFHLGVPTASVVEEPDGFSLHLADGRVIRAEAVLAGIGTEPNTEWLIGSGVELDAGVVTDPAGRTNVPGVWACGDVASSYDPGLGRHRRFEHWTHAIAQGRHVGLNIALGRSEPYAAVPYIWTEQHGHTLHLLGERRPGDTDITLEGDPTTGDFVVAHADGADLHGVTTCGRSRALRTYKALLRAGASLDEAARAATPA